MINTQPIYEAPIPKLTILNKTVKGRSYDLGYYASKVNTRMDMDTPAG